MITWIVLFVAAVVFAFVAAYVLLRPIEPSVGRHENVVSFPREEHREKLG